MAARVVWSLLLLLVVLGLHSGARASFPMSTSGTILQNCKDEGIIPYDPFLVIKSATETDLTPSHQQCIWLDSSQDRFGWDWNRTAKGTVYFEEAIFGKNPYPHENPPAVTVLPKNIDQLSSLTATVNFTFANSGSTSEWDNVFDIWITNSSSALRNTVTDEVMVFFDWQNRPLDPPAPSVSDKFNRYSYEELLTPPNNQPKLHFFLIANRAPNGGSVDILHLLKWLNNRGAKLQYVADIEFGTETWYGSGSLTVNAYSISVSTLETSTSSSATQTSTPTTTLTASSTTATPTITSTTSSSTTRTWSTTTAAITSDSATTTASSSTPSSLTIATTTSSSTPLSTTTSSSTTPSSQTSSSTTSSQSTSSSTNIQTTTASTTTVQSATSTSATSSSTVQTSTPIQTITVTPTQTITVTVTVRGQGVTSARVTTSSSPPSTTTTSKPRPCHENCEPAPALDEFNILTLLLLIAPFIPRLAYVAAGRKFPSFF